MNRLWSRVSVIKQDLLDTGPQKPQFLRTERNIRINIYHGISSIMALNLAAPFVGIFAVRMGATSKDPRSGRYT